MKKLFALLLALTMVFSLAATGFAAGETTTYSITIENDVTGYTYEAYQIFIGDLVVKTATVDGKEVTTKTLSNVEWGTGVTYTGDGVVIGKDAENNDVISKEAADIADALAAGTLTLDALIKDLTLSTEAGKATAPNTEGNYVISGLASGYYLVKNSVVPTESSAYTDYIVKVVDNVEVTPKSDVPESEKKVKDTNDTVTIVPSDWATNTQNWADSADHDIGDTVPFVLTATLPDAATYEDYTTYSVTFHDKMDAGLTFDAASIKVFVGTIGTDGSYTYDNTKPVATSNYEVTTTGLTDGCTFEVSFADVKGIANADQTIFVTYTATLNEKAKLGSVGNSNDSWITYSNNPNNPNGTGEGKTPVDTVIVFTYKPTVNKVDKDNNALAGAEFTLYKKVLKTAATESAEAVYEWKQVGSAIDVDDNTTTFAWKGIDDGEYKLVETKTPAGYNSVDDIYFKVEATHSEGAEPALSTLTASGTIGEGTDASPITISTSIADGSTTPNISMNVVNKQGTELPETGGMGTTLFYIVGGIMVAAAVVLLVTKKRMGAEA